MRRIDKNIVLTYNIYFIIILINPFILHFIYNISILAHIQIPDTYNSHKYPASAILLLLNTNYQKYFYSLSKFNIIYIFTKII